MNRTRANTSSILLISLTSSLLFVGLLQCLLVSSFPLKSEFFRSGAPVLRPLFHGCSVGKAHQQLCARVSSSTSSSTPSSQQHEQIQQQNQQQQHPSGRRWKNRRKRQTFVPSPVRTVSPNEEEALMDQLGYLPPNVCCISARSGDVFDNIKDSGAMAQVFDPAIDTSSKGTGRPIAIKSYPLLVQLLNKNNNNNHDDEGSDSDSSNMINGKHNYDDCNLTPFPTFYWLTDPHVSRAISELERQGYVRNFQQRLEDDNELATQWWECHEQYAMEKWSLLSNQDREWLLEKDLQKDEENASRKRQSMREMIQYSGVAGTDHRGLRENNDAETTTTDGGSNTFVPSVKCLHSHYAHYRSQLSNDTGNDGTMEIAYNLIGRWTHELLVEQFPEIVL